MKPTGSFIKEIRSTGPAKLIDEEALKLIITIPILFAKGGIFGIISSS